MKPGLSRTALFVSAITIAGAIGFAFPSSMAMAQAADRGDTADVKPAAVKPDSADTLGGVTVQSPRPRSKLEDIPPAKAAAFDEEAAKQEAWKRYRKSTPPFGAGTLGQANDYPGLQSLLPQPDDGASAGPAAR